MFKGKFSPAPTKESNGTDIETFVNLYKKEISIKPKFEIVSGEDIIHWYNGDNYSNGNGKLNNSCMKHNRCTNYIRFYANNPDKVRLLILKDNKNDDLIKGRALLWNTSVPNNRIFMDRIYTVNDYDEYFFIDYAEKNGWIYKSKQSMENEISFIDSKNKIDIYHIQVDGFINNDKYPYMDTLKYYNIDDELLSNKEYSNDDIFLEDTYGGYEGSNRIYVEYYGMSYDEEDLISCSNGEYRLSDDCEYSDYYGEYIDINDDDYIRCDLCYDYDCLRLENDIVNVYDNDETATRDYADNYLEWSNYHNAYLIDSVWSDYHNSFIYKDESIEVYTDSELNETDHRINDEYDGHYYEKDGDYFDKDVEFDDED